MISQRAVRVVMLARQLRFGRKSEVLPGLQRQLFEEDVDTDIAATEVRLRKLLQPDDAGEKKSTSLPVRKPLPGSLPRIIKTIEPASTENCPDPECPGKLRHIRDEVSEKLEYIPAHFVVNQYVRPQYGCTCCQRVVSGEMLMQIIPKGNAEASLAAQVVVSKFRDYLPLYRQQHIFARANVDLSVSTMAGWVGAVSVALTPLAEQLRRLMLTREVIHAGETSMRILDNPAMKCGMVDYNASFRRYLFQIAQAERVSEIPADTLSDNIDGIMQVPEGFSGQRHGQATSRKTVCYLTTP